MESLSHFDQGPTKTTDPCLPNTSTVYGKNTFFLGPLLMIHDHIYLSKLSISTTKKKKRKRKKINIFVSYVQISHFCLNKMLNVLQVL